MIFGHRNDTRTEISVELPIQESSDYSSNDIFSAYSTHNYESTTDDIYLPLSIFHSDLSTLQILVKYLKEIKGMPISQISAYLNRDYKSIWTTYAAVKNKTIHVHSSAINIPLDAFSNRLLSPLESIVVHLKGLELKYSDISRLLKKDQRTIWTVYNRAKRKLQKVSANE